MTESGLVRHPPPNPYPFGPNDVATVLDRGLAEHPDRIAIIDGEHTLTWGELDAAVADVAEGIGPGQLCSWPAANSAETIIAILATFRAGATWLAHTTNAADACPAFSPSRVTDTAVALAQHDVGLVSFTSGTTGTPKAVAHSQHSMLAPGLLSIDLEPPTPGERIGTPLDVTNANIFMLGPLSALLRGTTFVVLPSRYAPTLAADIERFRVTRLFAVPTLAFDLVESPEVAPEQLASLNRVILGGSGAAQTILQRFTNRFGVRPTLSYGLSEAPTGVVRESIDDPIGSGRGFPLPHIEVVVLTSDGVEQQVGSEGEICIRAARNGPWAGTWTGTLGYVGEPDRTAALFSGGVLHTGDIGRVDEDGAVSVTGRLSDLIIRGGKNIDPLALDEAATSLDGVDHAVAVGVPDERLGQIVGLAVSTTRVDPVTVAEATARKAGVPVDAVVVVDAIPRTTMGKIDRLAVVSLFGPDSRIPKG